MEACFSDASPIEGFLKMFHQARFKRSVIIIDPGWTNLGVVFIQFSKVSPHFRKISQTISLSVGKSCKNIKAYQLAFEDAFSDFFHNAVIQGFLLESPSHIDSLIIESQPPVFRQNKKLEEYLVMWIVTRFNINNIFPFSPISVKNKLGLLCNGDHEKNKSEMIELISSSKDIVLGGDYDSHVSDCIGLFNIFLKSHKTVAKQMEYFKEFHS